MSAVAPSLDPATRQRIEATLHALEADRGSNWPLMLGIAGSLLFHSALMVPQVRDFFAQVHAHDGVDRTRQASFSVEREMEKRPPITAEQQQQEQEDMLRLGIEDGSEKSTMTWIGYKEYQEHLARLSTVEQAAFRDTDEGGQPMTAARQATPQVPQVPQPQPAAPQSPDTSAAPPGEPLPSPTATAAAAATPPAAQAAPATAPPAEAMAQRPAAPPPPSPADTRPAPQPEQPPAPPPVTAATRETLPTKSPDAVPIPVADENRIEPRIQPVERAPDATTAKEPTDAPPPPQAPKPQEAPPAKPVEPQPEAKPADPAQQPPPEPSPPQPPQPQQPALPAPQQPPQPQSTPPQPPASAPPTQAAPGQQQPSTSPTTGPSPDPSARPGAKPGPKADGELSDRESDATSMKASPQRDWKPGRPLAQKGLKLLTVRPEIDELTTISGGGRNPLVRIEFDNTGKVRNVVFLETTGSRMWDEPIEDSLYRWRADVQSSPKLRALPAGKTFKFEIRLLIFGQ